MTAGVYALRATGTAGPSLLLYDGRMTQVAERLITAPEFALLPDPPEGGKVELVRGRVVAMPPVGPEHGERAGLLVSMLTYFTRENDLGKLRVETGYWLALDPDLLRGPDVSFVSKQRLAGEELYHGGVRQVPDLAVEVVSPSDRDVDVQEKVDDYRAAGVQRVWVVRPALKTVTVHRPGGDAHTYGGDNALSSDDAGFDVTGFRLALAELFAD